MCCFTFDLSVILKLDDHGHAPKFERFFNAQLHCVSCKTEPVLNSGAGVSRFALTTIGHHAGAIQAQEIWIGITGSLKIQK